MKEYHCVRHPFFHRLISCKHTVKGIYGVNGSVCGWGNLEITEEVNRIGTSCMCVCVYRFLYSPVLHVNIEGRQAIMKYSLYYCLK
jgi:hypothetical protein